MNLLTILKLVPAVISFLVELYKAYKGFKAALPVNHPSPVKAFVQDKVLNPNYPKGGSVVQNTPIVLQANIPHGPLDRPESHWKQIDDIIDSDDFKRIKEGK